LNAESVGTVGIVDDESLLLYLSFVTSFAFTVEPELVDVVDSLTEAKLLPPLILFDASRSFLLSDDLLPSLFLFVGSALFDFDDVCPKGLVFRALGIEKNPGDCKEEGLVEEEVGVEI